MANIDNVQLPDGSSYNIVDNTSGFATQNYVDSAVASVTKTTIGLGNVDNTSDLNKPISTAAQEALDAKLSKSEVATTESTNVASRTYEMFDQFYTSDGILRKATTTINSGATIVTSGTGQNCAVAEDLADQISYLIHNQVMTRVSNGTTLDQIINLITDERKKTFFCETLGTANLPSDFPTNATFSFVEVERYYSTIVCIKLITFEQNTSRPTSEWTGYRINSTYFWTQTANKSKVYPVTLGSGITTAEPQNCNYTIDGDLCIVNIAGATFDGTSAVATALPPARCRANTIVNNGTSIVYIDQNSNTLLATAAFAGQYFQLVYPIA